MADNYSQATVSPPLPADLFTGEELESLSIACGLTGEPVGSLRYLRAEDHFCEEGESAQGAYFNGLDFLQEKLRRLPPGEFPAIIIEGASTCSKMREGEFGGFAFYITRDEVRFFSTWQWLDEQTRAPTPCNNA